MLDMLNKGKIRIAILIAVLVENMSYGDFEDFIKLNIGNATLQDDTVQFFSDVVDFRNCIPKDVTGSYGFLALGYNDINNIITTEEFYNIIPRMHTLDLDFVDEYDDLEFDIPEGIGKVSSDVRALIIKLLAMVRFSKKLSNTQLEGAIGKLMSALDIQWISQDEIYEELIILLGFYKDLSTGVYTSAENKEYELTTLERMLLSGIRDGLFRQTSI